ncbi:MAG: hypothetical protein WC648_04285 [Candidatus Paceibacterota bacterium]|jgi:hypothetical protein
MNKILLINLAQAEVDLTKFGETISPIITHVVYPILGLMFAVAVLVFAYGVLQLVIRPDDGEARDNAKRSILYGIFGIFIMISAWGIVYLVSNTLKSV